MKKSKLIVFAKAPVPGRVKTRLGYSIGMLNAARVYRTLCSDFLRKVNNLPEIDIEVWATPDTHHPLFLWCRRVLGLKVKRQPEGDLGERMYRSIKASLKEYSTVILTGTDMPEISISDLQKSVEVLDGGYDVVFAPSTDGGYGLVAVQQSIHSIFYNMPWSCENVLEVSLLRLKRSHLKSFLLDTYDDIDTLSDYKKFLKQQ